MTGGRAVRVLVNPRAGRGVDWRRLADDGGMRGLDWTEAESAGELAAVAAEAVRRGDERIVVVGGDGTIRLAVSHLARSRCGLGIVPAGSGNDLARSLGLLRPPVEALRTALNAPLSPLDVGVVDGRPFACVAGIGIDGEVAAYVNRRATRFRGPWSYPFAVLRTVFRFRAPRVTVEYAEGGVSDEPMMLAAFANTSCFGGGMRVAPDAVADDGLLDLVLVRDAPRLRLLPLLARVYRGTHVTHPLVRVLRVREARIRADRTIDVWADGERLGTVAPEGSLVGVWPGALHVARG